jgi:hypothetical protein
MLRNTFGTTKVKTPTPSHKRNLGACCLTSFAARFFLPTHVLCHFWRRLMEGAWTSRTSFSCYGCTFRPLPVFVTSSVHCILSPSHIHANMDSIMCETIQMPPPPVYSFQRNWSLHTFLQLFTTLIHKLCIRLKPIVKKKLDGKLKPQDCQDSSSKSSAHFGMP